MSLLASFSCLALSLFLGLAVFTPTYPAFFLVHVTGVGNALSLSHYALPLTLQRALPVSLQRALPLTLRHMQQVLLWATVVFVIVGGVVLLGYNLLPPGSFSRAWRGDIETGGDDDEENKWTRAQYAGPNQGANYGGAAPMRQV